MSNYDDDDIITLTSSNGEEIDFVEIAGIALNGSFYTIMQPVELLDGMDENEALVFKTTKKPNGEAQYTIELDDKIIDRVFAEYNRLLDEADSKSKSNSLSNREVKTSKARKVINSTKNAARKVARGTGKLFKTLVSIAVGIIVIGIAIAIVISLI